jgi:CRP/FNR family cyclic AMP-dependent transcriptional regulator
VSISTLLRNVAYFTGLSDQELELLGDSLGRRTFNKGMILFHEGSPGETLYIIESGQVRIFLLSESGQEISVNIFGPGDAFGELSLLDGLPRSTGALAMERTVTLTLHREDFLRHLEATPRMARSILDVLSRRLRYTTTYAESLALLDVYGRVAAKLLELADRYGVQEERADGQHAVDRPGRSDETQPTEIDLHMTQAELASLVGATRESVNKVLGTLRDQQLIDIRGQRMAILDRRGLERHIQR